jgi:hypothetical protein
MNVIRGFGFCLAMAMLPSRQAAVFAQDQAHTFLKNVGGFDESALARLDKGEVITRVLDTGDKNELALMGAARMNGTIAAFLPLYRDIENFEKTLGPAKKFSSPPQANDVAGVELESSELKALESCKIEDCDIHLSESALAELRKQVHWKDPNADREALEYVRGRILGYMRAYQEGGNEALSVYRSSSEPRAVAAEFEKLLEQSPYIQTYVPELHRYLLDYPRARLPGATDFLYWSIVGFGPHPTLRLSHVTIDPVEKGDNAKTVIASKQIYYSRYFDTGLELYTLLPIETAPEHGFYLIALSRYRTDLGSGLSGKVMRLGASSGVEGAMKKTIENAQAAVR